MPHTPIRFSQNVALIGLSGTGKSTVGRMLAARLSWPLIDTDVLIEQTAGRRIPQIFAEQGEPYFRDLETQALDRALAATRSIISTGGGAILREANRHMLTSRALVVWLDATTATLVARLRAHDESRPLLAGENPTARLEALRVARAPLYSTTAQLQIDTGICTPAQVADKIIALLTKSAPS